MADNDSILELNSNEKHPKELIKYKITSKPFAEYDAAFLKLLENNAAKEGAISKLDWIVKNDATISWTLTGIFIAGVTLVILAMLCTGINPEIIVQ